VKLPYRSEACLFGKARDAYTRYVGPDFRHHNPFFRGDRESLMLAMEENATKNPDKKLEIKLTLEDRDLVVTYSHVQQNAEDPGAAVFIFSGLKNGQIIELWDVGQAIPQDSVNENGMF